MTGGITLQALGITLDDSPSEVRGKLADLLLAGGFEREVLPKLIAAKKSQLYVDLKAAFRSKARLARLSRQAFPSDDRDGRAA